MNSGFFDLNLAVHAWLPLVQPAYDFMVVVEVQDLTSVRLALLLKTLVSKSAPTDHAVTDAEASHQSKNQFQFIRQMHG